MIPYLPNVWASDITAEARGDEIVVTGKIPLTVSDLERSRDPYLGYVQSVKAKFAQKQTGKNSPHIRFANAHDDDRLIAFVKEFGPVVPSEVSIVDSDQPTDFEENAEWRAPIRAIQPLLTLRSEQRVFAASLRLMTQLRLGQEKCDGRMVLEHIAEICDGVSHWPHQYQVERRWRKGQSFGPASWYFDKEDYGLMQWLWSQVQSRLTFESTPAPKRESYSDLDSYLAEEGKYKLKAAVVSKTHRSAHGVLCKLINAFRTDVGHNFGDHPAEFLSIFSLRFGIRPALYLILRNEYLGRGGTAICGNDRCSEFFVSQRAGQQYCSAECSRQYRQRKYWSRTGARNRKRRRAKVREKAKSGT